MKFSKEEKNKIINNFDKSFNERILKNNIMTYEEVNTSTFIGVKFMIKKKETPPEWFINIFAPFATEVREFMKMQIEFNKNQIQFNSEVRKDISEIKQDIIELKQDVAAIKSCPTIKKELGL